MPYHVSIYRVFVKNSIVLVRCYDNIILAPRGAVHLNSYSLIMHSLRLDAFQAHASHAWNHKGAMTRPSSTESVDSGDLKKDAV